MKFRNNWKSPNKQWDKLIVKFRLSSFDLFSVEIDVSREFYSLTLFNFTIKNR